jgi:hypothetical protein
MIKAISGIRFFPSLLRSFSSAQGKIEVFIDDVSFKVILRLRVIIG